MTKSVQKKSTCQLRHPSGLLAEIYPLLKKVMKQGGQGRKFKLSELPHLRIEVARDPSEDPMNVGPKSVFGHYDYDYGIV